MSKPIAKPNATAVAAASAQSLRAEVRATFVEEGKFGIRFGNVKGSEPGPMKIIKINPYGMAAQQPQLTRELVLRLRAILFFSAAIDSLVSLRPPPFLARTPTASSAATPELGAPRPPVEVGQSWALGRVAFSLLPLTGSERRKTLQ